MRIWDIHPGYLNRQSLLGEHRELHGIISILTNGKKGYSHHPETIRWIDYEWALDQRHRILVAEMNLRGYQDRSPVISKEKTKSWPPTYIDTPARQFQILAEKYRDKSPGRIPLPKNAQELWRHHKYSVMARDVNEYKRIGKLVSNMKPKENLTNIATTLVELMRTPPTKGNKENAARHMWGYVSDRNTEAGIENWSIPYLLKKIQTLSREKPEPYLTESTALSDLLAWR